MRRWIVYLFFGLRAIFSFSKPTILWREVRIGATLIIVITLFLHIFQCTCGIPIKGLLKGVQNQSLYRKV